MAVLLFWVLLPSRLSGELLQEFDESCPQPSVMSASTGAADPQAQPSGLPEEAKLPVQISLVRIPAGEFLMGSAEPEVYGRFSRPEGPQHQVRIRREFLMSRCEVTVGQFEAFVAATGYRTEAERNGLGCNGLDINTGAVVQRPGCIWKSPGFAQSDSHPVVCVSQGDAAAFCRWLSGSSGLTCRLPTESEWEYCCRAGASTTFSSGDNPQSLRRVANCGDRSLAKACVAVSASAAWDDRYPFTAPVGTFEPNGFGLHDMHGNVGEWCHDWYDATWYSRSPAEDPRGPDQPTAWHVVRGGSWYNTPAGCRSAGRHDGIETAASTTNGFRIVVELRSADDQR